MGIILQFVLSGFIIAYLHTHNYLDSSKKNLVLILSILVSSILVGAYLNWLYGFNEILVTKLLLIEYLVVATIEDVLEKKIELGLIISFIIITVICNILISDYSLVTSSILIITSITVTFIINLILKDAIGWGDCLILVGIAFIQSSQEFISLILYAAILNGIIALLMLTTKKYSKKDTLPLMPCIYLSLCLVLVIG